ncbi:ankyrin repeat-containing domain protein [Mycena rosella]|uniref:Ankyrin repeat-containing domain protein n=1 Tax=Mycena rosella TaxID=1033263 RepID=A0AAD7M9E2_MYCRO|nr:ankyrin repeat-containing domain protein [Mycena rosella]
MAEIVGLVASVLQLVDTVAKACGYITDFHNAPREQQRLLLEIQSLEPLVKELDRRILNAQLEDERQTSGLQAFSEPLIQLEALMERLSKKMKSEDILSTLEERRIDQNYIARSVRDVARNQEQYHDAAEREKIIEWFSPLNFFLRQADISSTRQPGTGEWLLQDELFKEWKSGSVKTVWCRGMPGAGKTVLASMVVNHLRASLESRSVGVAVIYLNHQETEAQSIPNLLAGLWRQLVVRKPISLAVSGLYEKHREQRTRSSLAEVDFILCSAISEMSNVFIIVDAVDEYPEQQRHALLRYLSALTAGSTVNLMLMSRPHLNLIPVVKNLQTLEIRATMDDIRRHVDAEIIKSPRLSRHIENRPQLREEIEDSVVLRSDGMFLLAKLHMDSLTTKHTVKAARDALSNMPGNLDSTYDEVVERINRQSEDDQKLAWCTLSRVAHAKRPLRPSELREALAVEPGTTTLDRDNLLDIDTILSVCAGLVVINDGDKRLRLIHYTTQTYLDHVQSRVFLHASMEITTTCITYLSFDVFSQRAANDPMNLFYRNSLLDYAVEYCLIHARGQSELNIPQFILNFLADCRAFWKLWNWKRGYEQCQSASRLQIAASFHLNEATRYLIKQDGGGDMLQQAAAEGLTELVQFLIDNGIHPDATRTEGAFEYDSALQAASAQGHTDIICLLLDHGANIDSPGPTGTALQLAALRDKKEPLCLLLSRGANVNTEGGRYGTALYAATIQCNEEMLHLLLENGAAVNEKGGHYGTALGAVVCRGFEVIARVLVKHGADLNAETTLHSRPVSLLHRAISTGPEAIARLLIEKGAVINAAGSSGNPLDIALAHRKYEVACLLIAHGVKINDTALCIASSGGSHELVRILLEHGAEVEEDSLSAALHAGLLEGHKEVVRLLIEHNAHVDAKDEQAGSMLQAAIGMGEKAIARLLIERGADTLLERGAEVNAMGGRFPAAIHAASSEGHDEIVCLLIEHDAEHGTALRAASRAGHKDIVNLLIKHGADVNSESGGGNVTVLQAASWAGHKDIVRLLLEHGADVNVGGGAQGSPLWAASFRGGKEVVKVLLEHGADVSFVGGWRNCTPLQTAALEGHKKIVELLLEHGADANFVGRWGNCTSLKTASLKGHKDIVQLLIQHGAVQEEWYLTSYSDDASAD